MMQQPHVILSAEPPETPQPARVLAAVAIVLAVIEIAFDWATWVSLDVSIVYSLPLVLAAIARSRKLLWALTLLLAITAIGVYFDQLRSQTFFWTEPFFINRVLSVVTLFITAAMLHAWTLALDRLALQRKALAAQNAELAVHRQAAEEATRRKSRILASFSHDIRSPLTAISALAEVICDAVTHPATSKDIPMLAQRLQSSTVSLNDLVRDVLDFYNFDSGTAVVHKSEFALADLLAEETARVEQPARAKGLHVDVDAKVRGLRLRTDRTKLARVLANLLTNAVKFTSSGGITVTATVTSGGEPTIEVRDTGVGIPPAHVSRIFDEFARVDSATQDSGPGWGLGLAISKRLVELLGGTISVHSELGAGSAFTIRLPATALITRMQVPGAIERREPASRSAS